ncbi:hypothetical protein KL918_003742 [Ogataea parapolymorpha]|uniref:Ubiquitin-conjugating enzyme E2 n=1 Tax=Ogataea parapolymorpha (strain ATCC 26012 / BCRC 20466 / JCM 22074 / NRRL Y-7560 / DL-1) TaxID=871575 RepID=W1QK23_OGAPD|nr:Ubiquitin-conjugating enzyme E2 [Ogataea parapolymorpha DL-1]ESX02197.1 Ubiquitin-conjugating enzyme E2 [Ogataea parapolymorpha DL-1]KAG7866277.1 hypothetical protein KL918_003742 [Ogataea parapolymorpha]KAG7872905.1 hypothetical protein KL916_002635 [Ogataea parapolymorpha]KAG7884537.1 hypothetical protein KL938_001664 [Ogataea parapolymorpha]
MATHAAAKRLWKEYKDISNPRTGLKQVHVEIEDDNIFLWNVALIVIDKDADYNGAYLKGQLKFPSNYPFSPPGFKFTPPIYHPNVYNDGRLCISILHESGNDQNDEPDNETWSPAQSVESVLLSIISLLEDPNISSPANVDAAIAFKKHRDEYRKRISVEVARSQANIPKDFVMPNAEDLKHNLKEEEERQDDEDWWEDNYYEAEDDYEDDEEDMEYDEEDQVLESDE